jgi:hypothetical protein
VRIVNFRKQPNGSPESRQYSRRIPSHSRPSGWLPHSSANPTTVRSASPSYALCAELHPRHDNGPRWNASHRPKGVESEFPQRQYTSPGPAKKRRKCAGQRFRIFPYSLALGAVGLRCVGICRRRSVRRGEEGTPRKRYRRRPALGRDCGGPALRGRLSRDWTQMQHIRSAGYQDASLRLRDAILRIMEWRNIHGKRCSLC